MATMVIQAATRLLQPGTSLCEILRHCYTECGYDVPKIIKHLELNQSLGTIASKELCTPTILEQDWIPGGGF